MVKTAVSMILGMAQLPSGPGLDRDTGTNRTASRTRRRATRSWSGLAGPERGRAISS